MESVKSTSEKEEFNFWHEFKMQCIRSTRFYLDPVISFWRYIHSPGKKSPLKDCWRYIITPYPDKELWGE